MSARGDSAPSAVRCPPPAGIRPAGVRGPQLRPAPRHRDHRGCRGRHPAVRTGRPAVQRPRPVAAGDHRPRQGRQGPDRQDRPRGRPEPGPVHPRPLPARPGPAAPAVAGSRQPGAADRRRDLPDDHPPRPPVRRGRLPAPVPAPLQPHLAGPRWPRGDLMELNGWTSPQMLRRYDASVRSARARRTYDRIMPDT
jgi:hypothetical protein